ncbi:MAG: hypothetical protein HC923_12530 [Myxococcales bacterium]|nr:hypothetical protein [Myxococcales bacterium]
MRVERDTAEEWLVVATAASEFLEDDIVVDLGVEVPGALVTRPKRGARRLGELKSPRHARVGIEARLREANERLGLPLPRAIAGSTALRGATTSGIAKQSTSCSESNPSCGDDAVCIFESASSEGVCETELEVRVRDDLDAPMGADVFNARSGAWPQASPSSWTSMTA